MRLFYNSNKIFLTVIIIILLILSTLIIPNSIIQNALAQINSSSNIPLASPTLSCDPNSPPLASGSTGPKVKELQQDLTKLGYDVGPKGTDSIFGPDTRTAVDEYQADHGLKVYGNVGPETWASICSSLASSNNTNANEIPSSTT